MATFTFFDEFKRYIADGVIDIDGDTFTIYLTNNAPDVAAHTVLVDLAGITEQNGYSASNLTVSWAETGAGTGIWRWANNADIAWTATGGSFGPFRYAVIYDNTPTSPADPLVGYWDNGSAATITDGNSFTVDLDANFSIFTLDG